MGRGRTLFEIGVFRIDNQELNTGNIHGDTENSRDIEELHSIAPSLQQPTLICDERNLKDSYIDREENKVLGFTDTEQDIQGNIDMEIETVNSKNREMLSQGPIDIGEVLENSLTTEMIENVLRVGHKTHPTKFPDDCIGKGFPTYVLERKMKNGETELRSWIVFSEKKGAIFCLPCVLFSSSIGYDKIGQTQSVLASNKGWGADRKWKNLYIRIPEHESANIHKRCYIKWRELEQKLNENKGIDDLLQSQVEAEVVKWKSILTRILDVTMFLGERALAFRGSTQRVGNIHNGNFLGILELISHYDPILREHLSNVQNSQEKGKRLQAHYLSDTSQNEFISLCAKSLRYRILDQLRDSKYFSIIVDSTPDSSHKEQTTFILRYLMKENGIFSVYERFLKFADCSNKSGADIALLIVQTLQEFQIPIADCRGQGYDNAANTSGKYNGVQKHILDLNSFAIFSPCGCHSLNLCGADSATCCRHAITYFGVIQTVYNLFSSSPQKGLSGTRWTDRVASVRPFSKSLPGLRVALEKLQSLNLTPKTSSDVDGALGYLSQFTCVIMSSMWLKILVEIDNTNQVIQARETTINVEVSNLRSLIQRLQKLKDSWSAILNESELVASAMGISSEFPTHRKRKSKTFFDSSGNDQPESSLSGSAEFKEKSFDIIMESVLSGISRRFKSAENINSLFCFLWMYIEMNEDVLSISCVEFAKFYFMDVCEEDLVNEIFHLKSIHQANFGERQLNPLDLLNIIHKQNLQEIFCNISVALVFSAYSRLQLPLVNELLASYH